MSKIKKINFSKNDLSKLIIHPKRDANKYSRGVCNVVAGSKKYPGAAILTASAAQKSGAGYTKLFTEKENVLSIVSAHPSLVCQTFADLEIEQNADSVKPEGYVVGPGFEESNSSNTNIVLKILSESFSPVLIDAGAFSTLKNKSVRDAIYFRASNNLDTILTPHAGEAKQIAKFYGLDYLVNQKEDAQNLAIETGATIVLKGPNTIVCNDKFFCEIKRGTAALAKAGSGDVLAGILGGLLCQGQNSTFKNCVLGVNVHAQAGVMATKNLNDIAVTPQDLIDCIALAFNTI